MPQVEAAIKAAQGKQVKGINNNKHVSKEGAQVQHYSRIDSTQRTLKSSQS